MKQFYFFMMVMILTSCSENLAVNELQSVEAGIETKHEISAQDSVASLLYRARCGDGKAYLKLADCYRDGYGVKKDLAGMLMMTMMAVDRGSIKRVDNYFDGVPDDSEFKQLYLLVDSHNMVAKESVDSIKNILVEHDNPDARAILGLIAVEHGDTIGGVSLIKEAAAQGCTLAELAMTFPDYFGREKPDVAKILEIADRFPLVYSILGDMYFEREENGGMDRQRAAEYYLLAEQHGVLTHLGAVRLLNICLIGGEIQLSEDDIQRLKQIIDAGSTKTEVLGKSSYSEAIYCF